MKDDSKAVLIAIFFFFSAALIAFPAFAQYDAVGSAETEATRTIIADQIGAFKAGDHDRAYSHAAPNIKRHFTTVDRFIGMVKRGYGAVYNPDSYVFGRNMQYNGEVYQEVIITDPAGKQWQAVYTLRQQEDGSWKITGVKMNPYKGATT